MFLLIRPRPRSTTPCWRLPASFLLAAHCIRVLQYIILNIHSPGEGRGAASSREQASEFRGSASTTEHTSSSRVEEFSDYFQYSRERPVRRVEEVIHGKSGHEPRRQSFIIFDDVAVFFVCGVDGEIASRNLRMDRWARSARRLAQKAQEHHALPDGAVKKVNSKLCSDA